MPVPFRAPPTLRDDDLLSDFVCTWEAVSALIGSPGGGRRSDLRRAGEMAMLRAIGRRLARRRGRADLRTGD